MTGRCQTIMLLALQGTNEQIGATGCELEYSQPGKKLGAKGNPLSNQQVKPTLRIFRGVRRVSRMRY
jgi:hypothetical protein